MAFPHLLSRAPSPGKMPPANDSGRTAHGPARQNERGVPPQTRSRDQVGCLVREHRMSPQMVPKYKYKYMDVRMRERESEWGKTTPEFR